MSRTRAMVWLALLLVAVGSVVRAQKPSDTMPPGKNPFLGNKASIQSGLAVYRVRCGDCHGLDARGYRGPALTALPGGMPDRRPFHTVRQAYCPSDARLLDRHGVVLHELRTDPTRRRLAWTPLAAYDHPQTCPPAFMPVW